MKQSPFRVSLQNTFVDKRGKLRNDLETSRSIVAVQKRVARKYDMHTPREVYMTIRFRIKKEGLSAEIQDMLKDPDIRVMRKLGQQVCKKKR